MSRYGLPAYQADRDLRESLENLNVTEKGLEIVFQNDAVPGLSLIAPSDTSTVFSTVSFRNLLLLHLLLHSFFRHFPVGRYH